MSKLIIAGSEMAPNDAYLFNSMMRSDDFVTDAESISNGAGSVTFEVPGGYEGVLQASMPSGEPVTWIKDCVKKNSKITIAGAELNSSKTEVLPNETLTITGNGLRVPDLYPGQRTSSWMTCRS